MTPATMGELAKLPRIVGVKDATGDVSRVSDQRAACGKDFIQLSGEDASALGFNAHGGTGCISVVANIAPRLCAEFQEAMLAGDYARALDYQDRLMPLHRAAFAEPNPAPDQVRAVAARQVHRGGPLADGAGRGADPRADARRHAARRAAQLTPDAGRGTGGRRRPVLLTPAGDHRSSDLV